MTARQSESTSDEDMSALTEGDTYDWIAIGE